MWLKTEEISKDVIIVFFTKSCVLQVLIVFVYFCILMSGRVSTGCYGNKDGYYNNYII